MILFDFLYYFIYRFYSKKEKGAATSAAAIIGGLLATNFLAILMFASFFIPLSLTKVFFIIVTIIFQVVTYIRYIYKEHNSIKSIEERWLKLKDSRKVKVRTFALLYTVLSIVVFFGLAIYLSSKRV